MKKKRTRKEIAEELSKFDAAVEGNPDASQRMIIEWLGISRSTLRHWLERKCGIDAAPELIAFFESPVGAAFLHRLILGAHFTFNLHRPCGVRAISLFLELSGLDRFVASSYGAQQKVAACMEEGAAMFAGEETERLGSEMPLKKISTVKDETFHPETCLVAIEPVSNYILLEKYASGRKAEDWTSSFKEATEGLNIEEIQCTSDEGRGLVSHVTNDLKAHHSPDLFHIQHEVTKGTSAVLESRKKKAEKALAEAAKEVNLHKEAKKSYYEVKHGPGRPPGFDKRIEKAAEQEKNAEKALETAEKHRESVRDAVKGISDSYHPYDLETGAPRSPEKVSHLIESHFSTIEQVASEADLPERCHKKISKAKRVVIKMTATITFYFLMIQAKIEALSLTPEMEQLAYNHLIPGIYLDLVSKKAKIRETGEAIRKKSEEMLRPFQSRDGPLKNMTQDEVIMLESVAVECAQLFQRSSSCVEGRNGHLSLYHHSLHRLSNRKLAALTAVHNFFTGRSHGTTPAERFFGSKPRDMFEWLLEKVDLPGRPAQKRFRAESKNYLWQSAA